ncbi:MAG: ArgE/DapE family deacylase [Candidatus Hodarchaeota archaeon]
MTSLKVDEEELLELLQELIKINSVNPSLASRGDGELKIAQYIGKYLEKMNLEVKYQKIDSNRANVIGLLKGVGGGRSIMLNGHVDTVSIEDMKIEPLNPTYKNGNVYGRGAFDMKSGLAAITIAVQSLIKAGKELEGDVILAFVADEEYSSLGTEMLLEGYSTDAAIVCEPTDLQITIAHKGFAWTKVEVFGKAAHGSLPDKGIDAIAKAGRILVEMENLGRNLTQKKHSLLGSPSIHASLISGGTELSTYPDYCKIELERRTLPGENLKTVEDEIESLIERISSEDKQFKASFDVFFYRPALEVSKEQSVVHALNKACQRILKREPEFTGTSGWMDSALLAKAGIPTVIFGPSGEGAHASVEYVNFESVITTTQILIETIMDFCGIANK